MEESTDAGNPPVALLPLDFSKEQYKRHLCLKVFSQFLEKTPHQAISFLDCLKVADMFLSPPGVTITTILILELK
jgi:hypothetical protein